MADNRTGTTAGSTGRGGSQGQPGGGGGFAEQAQSAMRGATDTASEMWEEASERGGRYLRQGTQAVGNLDSTTLGGLAVAGAIGFGIAWLIFGHRSTDDVARRMSEASERRRAGEGRSNRTH